MSARNRHLSFQQLAEELDFGVGRKAIRAALVKEGFHRRLAMRKPPISERNRVIRLQWAEEHLNWTQAQWNSILWTDETWITGGRHTRTWVTRRAGEEWDPTCIVEKHHISKNITLRSVRSVHLTHLTLERKSGTRMEPPYHTMHLTQPDATPNPQDAPDAAPSTQDAPDAAPNTQDAI